MTAGPAPGRPASPEMADPMATKMPAPMIAPTPSAVSWTAPRERLSPPPLSPSAMHWSTVLRASSWDISGVLQGIGLDCSGRAPASVVGSRSARQESARPVNPLVCGARELRRVERPGDVCRRLWGLHNVIVSTVSPLVGVPSGLRAGVKVYCDISAMNCLA